MKATLETFTIHSSNILLSINCFLIFYQLSTIFKFSPRFIIYVVLPGYLLNNHTNFTFAKWIIIISFFFNYTIYRTSSSNGTNTVLWNIGYIFFIDFLIGVPFTVLSCCTNIPSCEILLFYNNPCFKICLQDTVTCSSLFLFNIVLHMTGSKYHYHFVYLLNLTDTISWHSGLLIIYINYVP